MAVDWSRYREGFPERYWMPGEADKLFELLLSRWAAGSPGSGALLDIGGGAFGTQALLDCARSLGRPAYLVDPGIEAAPVGFAGSRSWGALGQVGAAVARGSINYLSDGQLGELGRSLGEGAVAMANTFLDPPSVEWRSRPARNGAGEQGLEWSRLDGRMVLHRLEFPSGAIEHSFHWRPAEEFERFLGPLRIVSRGANSAVLIGGPAAAGLDLSALEGWRIAK